MSTKKTRLVLPDAVKGLAVLLMIQVHVTEQLVDPALVESTYGKLSLFLGGVPAAPVFMLMMGYFIGFMGAAPGKMLRRGIILFGGGIALNILLNFSYIINFTRTGYPEMIPAAIFGADILPLAGLSLIIAGGLKKISGHPLFLMLIALLAAGLTPWVNTLADSWESGKYITAFFGGSAGWSYFPLFPWLAYPITGLAIYNFGIEKWNRISAWGKYLLMAVFTAVFIAGFRMGFEESTSLKDYYHHGIVFYLWALSFMALLIFGLSLLKFESYPLRAAFLSFAGREVTLVYVIQWILIGNLAAWAGKHATIFGHLSWTFFFILISTLLAFLYRSNFFSREKSK